MKKSEIRKLKAFVFEPDKKQVELLRKAIQNADKEYEKHKEKKEQQ